MYKTGNCKREANKYCRIFNNCIIISDSFWYIKKVSLDLEDPLHILYDNVS